MDTASFFGLQRVGDGHWRLPVVQGLCSGLGTLFGGSGLGATVEAVEAELGRPLVWATAQFLSYARPPSVLDLHVEEVVRGHRSSQVRASAIADGEPIFAVLATVGQRPEQHTGSWAEPADVPPPEQCPLRPMLSTHRGTIGERLEMRLASARAPEELPGPPGNGRCALWVRLPDVEVSAGTLAVIGDYVPFGISQALGQRAGGNSLDNTIRVVRRRPSTWVLADIRVHAVADGFAHGLVHLWSEDQELLATASQSTVVRAWRDDPERRGDQERA